MAVLHEPLIPAPKGDRLCQRKIMAKSLIIMAGATGLEPAASAVTGQRSNQLSYAPAGVGRSYRRP